MYSRYGTRSNAARFGRWASKPLGQLTVFASVVLLIGVASGVMMGAWTGATTEVVGGGKVASDIVDGNPGNFVGPAEIVASQFGPSFSFDGKSSQIVIADDPKLRLPGNMTVAAWINPERNMSDWARLVGKGSTGQRNYGLFRHPTGAILFQIHGATGSCNAWNPSVSATVAPLGRWTHVAGTFDGHFGRLAAL
jgi:hypothetical protein